MVLPRSERMQPSFNTRRASTPNIVTFCQFVGRQYSWNMFPGNITAFAPAQARPLLNTRSYVLTRYLFTEEGIR